MQIRAAKTALYRGVYYRSRLEACWAAFFHKHGIAVEYERRWFEFGDGVRYQPDFWIPESRAWFEVKGALSDEDHGKIVRLARAAAFRGELVLMGGAPAGYLFGEVDQQAKWNLNCSFGRCAHCDQWAVAMLACRACGFFETDPTRETYIDYHDSLGEIGCSSTFCSHDGFARDICLASGGMRRAHHRGCSGVFTWSGDAPEETTVSDSVRKWAADSAAALGRFVVVPKRTR